MIQPYPVVLLRHSAPSPLFAAWVKQFGPTRLARSLRVTRGQVHAWVTPFGKRYRPETATAQKIVELSKIEPLKGQGRPRPLDLEDIVGQVVVDAVEIRQ